LGPDVTTYHAEGDRFEHTKAWKDSVKAFEVLEDSLKSARAKAHADSVRAVSEARIAASQKSLNAVDNLEKMMQALISGGRHLTRRPRSRCFRSRCTGIEPSVGILAAEYAVVRLFGAQGNQGRRTRRCSRR